jgi:hypothetical protein
MRDPVKPRPYRRGTYRRNALSLAIASALYHVYGYRTGNG